MAVTALTQEQFEAQLLAAVNAMEGADYAEARKALARARFIAKSFPVNYTIAGHSETVQQELADLNEAIDDHMRADLGPGSTQIGLIGFGKHG